VSGPECSLVIVESPAKSKTIHRILGRGFLVKASFGHVMDLPKRSFGIDVEMNFEPTYKVLAQRAPVVRELKSLAKDAPMVYLATDPDREGEAIAYHLVLALKLPEGRFRRVTFHEITPEAVEKAFRNPGGLSNPRIQAQQVRRCLDRIVGYRLSPLLWEKISKRLSAGRVQSVALKFVVDREREIRAFKSEEYWEIVARFRKDSRTFEARLAHLDGQPARLGARAEAERAATEIRAAAHIVRRVTREHKTERPFPPLNTSLLQQRASVELGFAPKRTMIVAQQLYEGIDLGGAGPVGLITYMRTDSFRIAPEALSACRAWIRAAFGEAYVPPAPQNYRSPRAAQEAHEAIRPTHVEKTPDSIRGFLTADQYRLYRLIWNRFVASQMKEAVYLSTEVEIAAGRATLLARGRLPVFDGFTRLLRPAEKDHQPLPDLAEGERLQLETIEPQQHFTQPPPRYTEAGLIKVLEQHGIGRPSTYAPTLATLVDRGYVRIAERRLVPTELGTLVTEKLERHFQNFINAKFTAEMEESLDSIEEGKADATQVVSAFYRDFTLELEKASIEMASERERRVDQPCPRCGGGMTVRWTRFGKLIQCASESCGQKVTPEESHVPGQKCGGCGSPMALRFGRRGKFLSCIRYPECSFTRSIVRDRVVNVPEGIDLRCEKSLHPMAVRVSRRGAFLGCTGYPQCRNAKRIPPSWLVALSPRSSQRVEEPE
jgi:DNA topoisomerase-1